MFNTSFNTEYWQSLFNRHRFNNLEESSDDKEDVAIGHRLNDENLVNEINGDIEVANVIGIDFGTIDSCVSVCNKNGRMETVANERGERNIPTCVAFTPEGKCLVGRAAKDQLTIYPENTIQNVKRLIGMDFSDKELQNEIKHLPFEVIDKNNRPCIQIKTISDTKEYYPEEISAVVFKELKETAEKYLGEKVSHAVVTVPASFTSRQRQAVVDAGSIARLNVRIMNEQTAAAVGLYGNESESKKNILVFTVGAGSFEVTVLTKDHNKFKAIATGGNTQVGGICFTRRVVDYFVEMYRQKRGVDIRHDKCAMQELEKNVERAKKTLSSFPAIESVAVKSPRDKFILGKLTRSKFEELNEDLFQLTIETTQDVMDSAGMTKNDIDEVILTGGSTEIPKIRQIVNDFFECKEPVYASKERPSLGTAKLASTLFGDKDADTVTVSDVTGLSLGVNIIGRFMSVIIPRNTSIPAKQLKLYTTSRDNQPKISIKVFEGEHEMVTDNHFLDKFMLSGIQIAPRGVPKINVTMEIDVNGILLVSARDMSTDSENNIAIDYFRKRFVQSEIEQMIQNIENL